MGAVLEIGEEMADIIDQAYENGRLMREPDPAINSVSRAYPYGRC